MLEIDAAATSSALYGSALKDSVFGNEFNEA